jgi:hypothetical protein
MKANNRRPWYMHPLKTCAVLNRIASRFTFQQMDQLRSTMDQATITLWAKQEAFYGKN